MTLPLFDIDGLDAVIEAYAKGNVVNMPALVYFDFCDTPMPVWGGEYDLSAGGVTWRGLGAPAHLISISGIEQAAATQASQFTFTLSGVDSSILAIAASEDRADYVRRLVGVYVLFCDKDWQPISQPMAITAGLMGRMAITRQEQGDGTWLRQITLPCDNLFYGRSGAPASYYTDTDQKQRYPGDRMLELISQFSTQGVGIPEPWR